MPKKSTEKTRKNKIRLIFLLAAAGIAAILIVVNFFFPFAYLDNRFSSLAANPRREGELRIHFLDVGQGDCVMLEFPDGKTAVIDAGPSDSESSRIPVLYAKALKIKKFDYLVSTHADDDHCGGFSRLLNEADVDCAYLPYDGLETAGEAYLSFYRKITAAAKSVNESRRYSSIVGEGYYMVFLSPRSKESNPAYADENDSSAVLWLDYGGASALFTADISSTVERSLLAEYALDNTIFDTADGRKVELDSSEILKVAHHGSAYSSSLEWLSLLNFRTAVVSCGAGNSYGHPSAAALHNLKEANPAAEIYRTDECGYVVVTIKPDGTYTTEYEKSRSSKQAKEAAEQTKRLFALGFIHTKHTKHTKRNTHTEETVC